MTDLFSEEEIRDALAPNYILERLRLELIRLKSGVGTIAEVRAESDRARTLADS